MSIKVDPEFIKDLTAFGLSDANKCMHCGNCTAVCPLSENDTTFPRRLIKYAQMGMKEKILQSPEPWLCYYCGDCSDTCPRGADPGEFMMVMRRYLTSRYDWTGFAKRFYTSKVFELTAVIVVAIIVGLLLVIFRADNPNMKNAYVNSVWPAGAIEIADLIMASVLSILLLSNTSAVQGLSWETSCSGCLCASTCEMPGNFLSIFLLKSGLINVQTGPSGLCT